MSTVDLPRDAQAWRANRGRLAAWGARLIGFAPSLWQGRSLRWQVLATFMLINMVAAAATASIVVYNAKRATEAEIGASIAVAERFVRTSIDNLDRTIPGGLFLGDLAGQIGPMRHVRLLISTVSGKPVWVARYSPDPGRPQQSPAPRWFASLVQVDDLSHEVPVLSGGRRIGTVMVIGDPRDEIAEVWSDMSDLAVIGGLVDLGVILVLYFAFGRVLTPLSALSEGLRELEQGRFQHRLTEPKAYELADLSRRFNALAGSLGHARTENIRLNRYLMTAQEDERRLIAKELHDELGPCLFGLRANMTSLDKLASDGPADRAGPVRDRVKILADIAERIQMVNRRLLHRLRPIALGDMPLADTLAALVAEFMRHDGAPKIDLQAQQLASSYGDCVDLTIYRCVQEGLTNVMKHSQSRSVGICIEDSFLASYSDGGCCRELRLTLKDDGRGIAGAALGMGLTGMKERVQALGGSFAISGQAAGGTRLEIVLPSETPDGHGTQAANEPGNQ